jgi:hypothetical protein
MEGRKEKKKEGREGEGREGEGEREGRYSGDHQLFTTWRRNLKHTTQRHTASK